jgi:hypothetical protein
MALDKPPARGQTSVWDQTSVWVAALVVFPLIVIGVYWFGVFVETWFRPMRYAPMFLAAPAPAVATAVFASIRGLPGRWVALFAAVSAVSDLIWAVLTSWTYIIYGGANGGCS